MPLHHVLADLINDQPGPDACSEMIKSGSEFETDKIKRYHIFFSGRVQGIGFRLEIEHLALRLELSGWIKNLENGNVEMEIQGMKNKIDFLLNFMNSLKQIKIKQMQIENQIA